MGLSEMKRILGLIVCLLVFTITIGCAPKVETKVYTKTETIPFETIREENPTLPKEESQTKQEGVEGKKIVTYKAIFENSELKSEEKIKEKIIKKPRDRILIVGTPPVEKVIEKIPFKTQQVNDPALAEDKTEEGQKGEEGEIEKTFEISYKNGYEVSQKLISEVVIKEPKDRIVIVGTKPSVNKVKSILQKAFQKERIRIIKEINVIDTSDPSGYRKIYIKIYTTVVNVDRDYFPKDALLYLKGSSYTINEAVYESGIRVSTVAVNFYDYDGQFIFKTVLDKEKADQIDWENVTEPQLDRLWKITFVHPRLLFGE